MRALVFVAVGLFIVLDRDAAIDLAVLAVGLYVIYKGVEELLRLIAPRRGGGGATAAELAGRRRRRIALATAAAVFVGVTRDRAHGGVQQTAARPLPWARAATAAPSSATGRWPTSPCPPPTTRCRPPTSPGCFFPNQERGIPEQLDDGVRGLLIDTHYGFPANGGKVKTDLSDFTNSERKEYVEELRPEAVDAALRIRDRLVTGGDRSERQIYLCHRFCELGAIPLGKGLDEIRNFVVQHPDQVLVIVDEELREPEGLRGGGRGERPRRVRLQGPDHGLRRPPSARWSRAATAWS